MRLYKSGTAWCLWRWTITDSEYIVRLHLIKTPWFAICLHWIKKPDAELYLHDHPVSFLSIVLNGQYEEIRGKVLLSGEIATVPLTHQYINWFKADKTDVHRITEVAANTLTLCFMGPKTREWGFHTPTGWIYWKDYYTMQRNSKKVTI
jgi:hypothetical protein